MTSRRAAGPGRGSSPSTIPSRITHPPSPSAPTARSSPRVPPIIGFISSTPRVGPCSGSSPAITGIPGRWPSRRMAGSSIPRGGTGRSARGTSRPVSSSIRPPGSARRALSPRRQTAGRWPTWTTPARSGSSTPRMARNVARSPWPAPGIRSWPSRRTAGDWPAGAPVAIGSASPSGTCRRADCSTDGTGPRGATRIRTSSPSPSRRTAGDWPPRSSASRRRTSGTWRPAGRSRDWRTIRSMGSLQPRWQDAGHWGLGFDRPILGHGIGGASARGQGRRSGQGDAGIEPQRPAPDPRGPAQRPADIRRDATHRTGRSSPPPTSTGPVRIWQADDMRLRRSISVHGLVPLRGPELLAGRALAGDRVGRRWRRAVGPDDRRERLGSRPASERRLHGRLRPRRPNARQRRPGRRLLPLGSAAARRSAGRRSRLASGMTWPGTTSPAAYRAMWALSEIPDRAVALLAEKLRPVRTVIDLDRIDAGLPPRGDPATAAHETLLIEKDPKVVSAVAVAASRLAAGPDRHPRRDRDARRAGGPGSQAETWGASPPPRGIGPGSHDHESGRSRRLEPADTAGSGHSSSCRGRASARPWLRSSGMIRLASTLPSSTPHWSNELICQIVPWVKTLCS